MVYNVDAEDRDIALSRQTISTPCGCRCLLVTGYHAATFSTDQIVTCLNCASTDEVIAKIAGVLKKLKHEWNKRALSATGAGITTVTAFVATAGTSELLSGGLGSTTTGYFTVRLTHVGWMIRRLKNFREQIRQEPDLDTCKCVTWDGSKRVDGKCGLTFRNRPDDDAGN